MALFEDEHPTLENYWRSVILFGRNVASYKLALAKALLELSEQSQTFVTYEELAVPFARHVTEHLKLADKQGTFSSSRFLEACRKFNRDELAHDALLTTTAKLGFVNVIDAFHIVNNKAIPVRFFQERSDDSGIDLTDQLYQLHQHPQFANLSQEIESRWRLVETAWELNIGTNLVSVSYDDESRILYTKDRSLRRIDVTSSRPALNGYQKGKCFYCFSDLSLQSDMLIGADVDHFLPHTLKQRGLLSVNNVWNLVLACYSCNRGLGGKFAQVPEIRFLDRLHKRNEFLISSHHPLRETLMMQTGATESKRVQFLQQKYDDARQLLVHQWKPITELEAAF